MFFKKKKVIKENLNPNIAKVEPKITVDPDALEVFINSNEDKYAELFFENGVYTYTIFEKSFDDFEGNIFYYWLPSSNYGGYFDTREKAIKEIVSYIECEENK